MGKPENLKLNNSCGLVEYQYITDGIFNTKFDGIIFGDFNDYKVPQTKPYRAPTFKNK